MRQPGDRDFEPVEGSPSHSDPSRTSIGEDISVADDPYEELESVFEQPILLEEADVVETIEVPEEPKPARPPDEGLPDKLVEALARMDEVTRRLWARLEALEREVRGGSERTLEALRRLGERMGAELGMLDKRAINLELTLARLRSVTEAIEAGVRRPPEPKSVVSPPPLVSTPPPSPQASAPKPEVPSALDAEPGETLEPEDSVAPRLWQTSSPEISEEPEQARDDDADEDERPD